MPQPETKPNRESHRWMLLLGVFALALATVYGFFYIGMAKINRTLDAQSKLVLSRHGFVEYAEWGSGRQFLLFTEPEAAMIKVVFYRRLS